jgi:poly(A) polymerase
LLSDSGLLKAVLPEVEAMKNVPQPKEFHPEGDVFVHTMLLLDRLKDPSPVLALSALLHDVGKPPTLSFRDGRPHFYEHAPVGARMAEEILRRLRFSNHEIESVREAIDNHMKFSDVQRMREGKLKRFASRPGFGDEMELHRLDCEASHGQLDNYEFLEKKLADYAKEPLRPRPLLNGNDLKNLGMAPSIAMKPILEEAYTLQLEGRWKDREAVLEWARAEVLKAFEKGAPRISGG